MDLDIVSSTLNGTVRVERDEELHGIQAVVRFPNGYGASIIQNQYSYGVELAVIRWLSEGENDFELTYDTPVTDDVLGWLTEDALRTALVQISELSGAEVAGSVNAGVLEL